MRNLSHAELQNINGGSSNPENDLAAALIVGGIVGLIVLSALTPSPAYSTNYYEPMYYDICEVDYYDQYGFYMGTTFEYC